MKYKRLFVSIDMPAAVTQQLLALNPNMRGVRWLPPEQMHITLIFLGNVTPDVQEKIEEGLRAIEWSAFFLPITGIGSFPAKGRPNVIWAGVGTGHPHLFQLHKRVQEAALRLGFEPELRSWHPHVTIARCKDLSAEMIRPFLRANADFDAGMTRVHSFALKSSRLTPAGSVYTNELTIPARGHVERSETPH